MQTTSPAEVGNLVIVGTGWDNTDTAPGETTRLGCSDESSNIWVPIVEYTNAFGAAEDGQTVAFFGTVVSTQIDTGDDIIVTSSTPRVAKEVSAFEFDISEADFQVQDYTFDGNLAAGTTQPGPITVSGLPSQPYLLLHGLAVERPNSIVLTQDSDYTNLTNVGTSGGASTSNSAFFGGFRIATLTTDTVDVSLDIGGDHAQVLVALFETGGGTITQSINQATESELAQSILSYTVQYLRPTSDITDGTWTTDSGGSSLFDAINETTASSADYIRSSISPASPDICEIKLTSGSIPSIPGGSSRHIRYEYAKDAAGGDSIDLTVRLIQATTVIATWTHTDISVTPTRVDQTLSDAEASLITDYGDLRLRFEAVKA